MSEPTPDQPLVDIDDLRRFLQLSKNDDLDDDLQEVLDASLERVQQMVDVAVTGDEVTYRTRRRASGALLIPAGADELVSVTDPGGTTADPTEIDSADVDAGIIWPSTTDRRPGTWTITVRRPGASAAVALAVKIIAKHLWGVHRGTGGRAGPRGGVVAQDEQALAGFAIPRRARELLDPYLSTGGFA